MHWNSGKAKTRQIWCENSVAGFERLVSEPLYLTKERIEELQAVDAKVVSNPLKPSLSSPMYMRAVNTSNRLMSSIYTAINSWEDGALVVSQPLLIQKDYTAIKNKMLELPGTTEWDALVLEVPRNLSEEDKAIIATAFFNGLLILIKAGSFAVIKEVQEFTKKTARTFLEDTQLIDYIRKQMPSDVQRNRFLQANLDELLSPCGEVSFWDQCKDFITRIPLSIIPGASSVLDIYYTVYLIKEAVKLSGMVTLKERTAEDTDEANQEKQDKNVDHADEVASLAFTNTMRVNATRELVDFTLGKLLWGIGAGISAHSAKEDRPRVVKSVRKMIGSLQRCLMEKGALNAAEPEEAPSSTVVR